jgi:hypothetical protein
LQRANSFYGSEAQTVGESKNRPKAKVHLSLFRENTLFKANFSTLSFGFQVELYPIPTNHNATVLRNEA